MALEIALLAWGQDPATGGVRLIGRTRSPKLIAAVRRHLIAQLEGPEGLISPVAPGDLRLLGTPSEADPEPDEWS